MARARGIEVVLGDFCQGDSGSRTVQAMGPKLGVRIANEIGFHQWSASWLSPHRYARDRVTQTEGCKFGDCAFGGQLLGN